MSKRNRKGNAVSSRKKSAVYGMKTSRRRSGMTMGRDAERRAAGLHPHGKRAIEEIEGILEIASGGYGFVSTPDGHPVRSTADISPADHFRVHLRDGLIEAIVRGTVPLTLSDFAARQSSSREDAQRKASLDPFT